MTKPSFGESVDQFRNRDQLAADDRFAEMEAARLEHKERKQAFPGIPIEAVWKKEDGHEAQLNYCHDFLDFMEKLGYPGSVVVSPVDLTDVTNHEIAGAPRARGYRIGVFADLHHRSRPLRDEEDARSRLAPRANQPLRVQNVSAPIVLCEDGVLRLEDGGDITLAAQGKHFFTGSVESETRRVSNRNEFTSKDMAGRPHKYSVDIETIWPQPIEEVLMGIAAAAVPPGTVVSPRAVPPAPAIPLAPSPPPYKYERGTGYL